MTRALAAGRSAAIAFAALLVTILLVAACSVAPSRGPTFPPEGVTPPPPGDATTAAVGQVIAALAGRGLDAGVTSRAYRPPEAARLAASPRTVVQVTLPEDPRHGLVVVYALGSAEAARLAAEEQAAYVASGPGGIQFPPGTRIVLRVVGSAVAFFAWTPESAPDPRTPDIAAALEAVGVGVPIRG